MGSFLIEDEAQDRETRANNAEIARLRARRAVPLVHWTYGDGECDCGDVRPGDTCSNDYDDLTCPECSE